jgi:hypothetical protein
LLSDKIRNPQKESGYDQTKMARRYVEELTYVIKGPGQLQESTTKKEIRDMQRCISCCIDALATRSCKVR